MVRLLKVSGVTIIISFSMFCRGVARFASRVNAAFLTRSPVLTHPKDAPRHPYSQVSLATSASVGRLRFVHVPRASINIAANGDFPLTPDDDGYVQKISVSGLVYSQADCVGGAEVSAGERPEITVRLFTKDGCTLCDRAKEV